MNSDTQKTLKDLLSFSDEELLAMCNGNQEAADTLTNVYSCLEPILGQLSFDRLFQKKFPAKGEDANRFVSFCICEGKKRLTAEFVKTKGKMKNGEIFYKNLCLTGLKETGAALAKWNEKLSQATGEPASTNLGILPGWIDKEKTLYLGFLDLDNKGVIHGKIQRVIEILGLNTFISATPSGGRHLGVLSREPLTNVPFFKNIDVRGSTYVLAPGSRTEKGVYTVDLENPFFSTEIAVLPENWRELFKSRLEAEFGKEEEGTSSISVTSSKLQGKQGVKKENSNSPAKTRGTSFFWKEGERSLELTRYAGGKIHDYIKSDNLPGFVSHLKEVAAKRMENHSSFTLSDIQKVATFLWKKEKRNPTTNKPRGERRKEGTSSISGTPTNKSMKTRSYGHKQKFSSQGFHTDSLISFFSEKVKEETFGLSLGEIAPVVQAYFQALGFNFSKSIKPQVVAGVLKTAGFQSKLKKVKGKPQRLWNLPSQALQELQELIETLRTNRDPISVLKAVAEARSATDVEGRRETDVEENKQEEGTGIHPRPRIEGELLHHCVSRSRTNSQHSADKRDNLASQKGMELSGRLGEEGNCDQNGLRNGGYARIGLVKLPTWRSQDQIRNSDEEAISSGKGHYKPAASGALHAAYLASSKVVSREALSV